MEIIRGYREIIKNRFDETQEIVLEVDIQGPSTYDVSCFGVDQNNQLSDDRYMVFYNQQTSLYKEIQLVINQNRFSLHLNLSKLPVFIHRLVFTVSIDGEGTMGEMNHVIFTLRQAGREALILPLGGSDFRQEKAIVGMELYQKEEWRLSAIASGFNGGLSALLESFGGIEGKVSDQSFAGDKYQALLEKKLEQAAGLVSLVKPLKVTLEKKGLLNITARVALVLDISGSMSGRYKDGTVQMIVDKVLPIAIQFDDDGELDFWYYGTTAKRMPSVTLENYKEAVPKNHLPLMHAIGGRNNEVLVMEEVIEEYKKSPLPAYVIFISDGGVSSAGKMKKLMIESSILPIFWQFVGVGGSGYGILEKLDTIDGRIVDNGNFFALDDFKSIPDEELYTRLLNEFPVWLKEAKKEQIIR